MQSLGLNATELAAYGSALASHRTVSYELRVLDLSGNLETALKPAANSGQVDIDGDADVTRSCNLSFRDESGALQFEPGSPSDTAVYFDNMVQVIHRTRVPGIAKVVECPVFTGPLVKFDRTGDTVSIEGQGKESMARGGVPTLTIPRNRNKVDAIRQILADRCGETLFSFPTLPARLPSAVTVSWEEETWPWVVCKKIASSLGLQLFYDGAGVCRLRTLPADPVFRFASGDGGNITSRVQVTHDTDQIRNRVQVVGSKPTHTYTATLADAHPFSPYSLRRNGVRRYLSETISDDKIGSVSGAKARALAVLKDYERMSFGASLNAIPVPHLDELDMVRIETPEYVGTERFRQGSFPLTGGEMTVGYTDVVALPRRDLRKP